MRIPVDIFSQMIEHAEPLDELGDMLPLRLTSHETCLLPVILFVAYVCQT